MFSFARLLLQQRNPENATIQGANIDPFCLTLFCNHLSPCDDMLPAGQINGLWIVLAIATLFMSLPQYYQQFFYFHFWTHLVVANVIGLMVSVCFYVVGGEEPYARCVTKDSVSSVTGGGELRLKKPLSPCPR